MSHLFNSIRGLTSQNHAITSPEDDRYNCLAWVLGDESNFWWPAEDHYWPEDLPRTHSLETFDQLLNSYGYSRCPEGGLDRDFEKVVAYCDARERPQHFARQLSNGRWTSKLGKLNDVEHDLEALASHYGHKLVFWHRPRAHKASPTRVST